MQVVNFSHPLSPLNLMEIEDRIHTSADSVINIGVDCDLMGDLRDQVRVLVDNAGVDSESWQVQPPMIVLPGHSAIAAVLLAELHGRIGHFPAIIRIAPVENSIPRQFSVVEILNLQGIRDDARRQRCAT